MSKTEITYRLKIAYIWARAVVAVAAYVGYAMVAYGVNEKITPHVTSIERVLVLSLSFAGLYLVLTWLMERTRLYPATEPR